MGLSLRHNGPSRSCSSPSVPQKRPMRAQRARRPHDESRQTRFSRSGAGSPGTAGNANRRQRRANRSSPSGSQSPARYRVLIPVPIRDCLCVAPQPRALTTRVARMKRFFPIAHTAEFGAQHFWYAFLITLSSSRRQGQYAFSSDDEHKTNSPGSGSVSQ